MMMLRQLHGNTKPIFHCDAKTFALAETPNAKFCVENTNMSKNAKICITPNAIFKMCISPNAKPKCKSVEYRLHWVPNANFSHWPFHFLCVDFIHVG